MNNLVTIALAAIAVGGAALGFMAFDTQMRPALVFEAFAASAVQGSSGGAPDTSGESSGDSADLSSLSASGVDAGPAPTMIDGKLRPMPKGQLKPAYYVSLETPLLVSIPDGGEMRYVEVTVSLRTADAGNLPIIRKHLPRVQSAIVEVLNTQDYHELMQSRGKESLRLGSLHEVRRVLTEETGAGRVDDLYFMTLVGQ